MNNERDLSLILLGWSLASTLEVRKEIVKDMRGVTSDVSRLLVCLSEDDKKPIIDFLASMKVEIKPKVPLYASILETLRVAYSNMILRGFRKKVADCAMNGATEHSVNEIRRYLDDVVQAMKDANPDLKPLKETKAQ